MRSMASTVSLNRVSASVIADVGGTGGGTTGGGGTSGARGRGGGTTGGGTWTTGGGTSGGGTSGGDTSGGGTSDRTFAGSIFGSEVSADAFASGVFTPPPPFPTWLGLGASSHPAVVVWLSGSTSSPSE
jgi:hypothetical protein